MTQESAILAGIPLTTENIPRILQTPPQPRLLANRFRQFLTSLNFAIQTLPPPKNVAERIEKVTLNYTLAQYYLQAGRLRPGPRAALGDRGPRGGDGRGVLQEPYAASSAS